MVSNTTASDQRASGENTPTSTSQTRLSNFWLLNLPPLSNSAKNPCIFPQCGHIITLPNIDNHMKMSAHYFTTTAGTVLEIKKPSEPFSLERKVLRVALSVVDPCAIFLAMIELLGARCLMSLLRSPCPGRTRNICL